MIAALIVYGILRNEATKIIASGVRKGLGTDRYPALPDPKYLEAESFVRAEMHRERQALIQQQSTPAAMAEAQKAANDAAFANRMLLLIAGAAAAVIVYCWSASFIKP